MSYSNIGSTVNRMNFEQLAKSMEKLSLYDGRGKAKIMQISPKVDFAKVIGSLDLDTIVRRMFDK